jgi:pSer/pThr/pTyr-binding forkhead associated (FHA) protein
MLIDGRSRVSVVPLAIDAARTAAAGVVGEAAHGEHFVLVVTDGESPGRCISIGSAPVVIGRGVGVDLQIKDPTVSRHHCVVWRASGRCWLRDLGSTNRTRVNNRSALIIEIFEGDVIVVGQTALALVGRGRREAPSGSDEASHS